MQADNMVFHKWCMRCKHCDKALSAGNYSANDGVLFCKPHFKQLFAESGGKYNFG
jgi:cysteine/glycine-rich protein